MPVRVHIPAQLRRLFETPDIAPLEAGTLTEVVAALDARHPGIAGRVFEPGGALRRYVNVFVDGEDVRWLDGAATAIADGAEVRIVPSIAGG